MICIVAIAKLRPNNWFLSEAKVAAIRKVWRDGLQEQVPPITIAEIEGELAVIDGNTRVFVAFENGRTEIEAEIVELTADDQHKDLYRFIHFEGPKNGVCSVADLKSRILPLEDYNDKWIKFCEGLGMTFAADVS